MTDVPPQGPFDLVIVGAGSAGLAAAREGRRRGAHVALIEADAPGGDCTFTGCIPSRTLTEAAADGLSFEAAAEVVRRNVEHVAATEAAHVLRQEGITVIEGRARLESPDRVVVDEVRYEAGAVVLATGAQPVIPPIDGLDDLAYLTNRTVFKLSRAPASLVVLGAGPIGCELGQAFARFGVHVTLIERQERLLPAEDPGASSVVAEALRRDGVDVRLGATITRVERVAGTDPDWVHLSDGQVVAAERVLIAAGRRAAVDGLGLEDVGVETDDRGYVRVGGHLRTSVDGIFAAGDVNGLLPYTHAADEMGRVAARNALTRRRKRTDFDLTGTPHVIYTRPEVAQVGVREGDAPRGARVAHLPMSEVDRAITARRTDGFVTLVAEPRPLLRWSGGGRLAGATIVHEHAGESINECALAIRTGMFTGRLAQTVHAYPTWGIAIRQAAAQFFGTVAGRTWREPDRD